jgi:MFS family permease
MERSYGWVIVGIGALMNCIAIGAMMSLAVFLAPMAEATGWSRAGIGVASTLTFVFMGIATFAWGALSDRFGPRIVVVLGTLILTLGLAVASNAASLVQFQLLFGGFIGVAAGSFYVPMISATTAWITHQRSLAVALVSAGMGMHPLIVAPSVRWLISAYDWRTAMLVMAAAAAILLLPATLWVRRLPPVALPSPQPGAIGAAVAEPPSLTALEAFRTPQFVTIALAYFFCCAAHSGPIFHMVSYAMLCGIAPMAAVSIYSVAGLSGLGGRIALGLLADRGGAKPVLATGLLVQALAIGTYLLVGQLGEFYALSIAFGFAYGGVMPLYAILVREWFGAKTMGTTFGAVTMASSIGMALGPSAGGWFYDHFGAYTWLYIVSLMIGLAAAAIAFAFPASKRADVGLRLKRAA